GNVFYRKLFWLLIMALRDVQIRVTQMDWTASAELPQEANVYSDKASVNTRAPFDLSDYIVDDSLPIRWQREFIKESLNAPQLLAMGQQISRTVSHPGYVVSNYFRVGQLGTGLIKWEVEVFYKGQKI